MTGLYNTIWIYMVLFISSTPVCTGEGRQQREQGPGVTALKRCWMSQHHVEVFHMLKWPSENLETSLELQAGFKQCTSLLLEHWCKGNQEIETSTLLGCWSNIAQTLLPSDGVVDQSAVFGTLLVPVKTGGLVLTSLQYINAHSTLCFMISSSEISYVWIFQYRHYPSNQANLDNTFRNECPWAPCTGFIPDPDSRVDA